MRQARDECQKHDSVLASPGQLFAAWRAGLDRCDYSWLSDGSVRYPVTIPRPQCGGSLLGVRTLYKNKNQTGYPDPTERFGVFCFKGETEHISMAWLSVWPKTFQIVRLIEENVIICKCQLPIFPNVWFWFDTRNEWWAMPVRAGTSAQTYFS